MPVANFKTELTAKESDNRTMAVANAARYLAYSDQTDSFGYHGNIHDISYDGDVVTLWWESVVVSPEELEAVNEEMKILTRVNVHECLSNPVDANL